MLTLLLATLYLLGATTGVHTSIPATTGATAPQPTLQTPATDTPAERRAETARLRLLQLDAAALGAATPSSDGGGEHTWSVSPRSRAVISDTGTWTDLPDSTLAFDLEREAHVVIRYVLVAVANKQYHAGGDFINEHQAASSTVSDYLGARLLLDSIPYRQSGSHAAPLSALETSTRQVSGYIVTRLGAGLHTVTLQWRKWGTRVSSWTVSSALRDGFVAGRTLTVSSRHRYLWFTQPLSIARTSVAAQSQQRWEDVRDMKVEFSLPRDWTLRFSYVLQVRPQGAPGKGVLGSQDYLTTRIVLDGSAYRESSSVTSSSTHTYGSSTLSGEVTLRVPKGKHTVKLQWRRYGQSVPLWWAHPHFLDGFVSGRFLAVTGEMQPYVVAQTLADTSVSTLAKEAAVTAASSGSVSSDSNAFTQNTTTSSSSMWHDIASTAIAFELHDRGRITYTYNVGVAQYGRPDWDAWTWSRWSAIGTRLVVDGRAFASTAASSDALVRANENLMGEITLTLPRGPHTARLQWRTFGESVREWSTFQTILDGFGGSRSLLAMVHAANARPVITTPIDGRENVSLSVSEDQSIALTDVQIRDADVSVTPHGTVAVTIAAAHGVISVNETAAKQLTFATGDGIDDEVMVFSGDLSKVNVALKSFSYKPHLDYNGLEEVKIRVTDQGSTGGAETGQSATKNVQIDVLPSNDAPAFTVPAPQMINEDATLLINGVGVYDVDIEDKNGGSRDGIFQVSLQVVSGKLSLRRRRAASPPEVKNSVDGNKDSGSGLVAASSTAQTTTAIIAQGLTFIQGDGFEDASMVFSGNLADINAALSRLEYTGDSNSNANFVSESLTLWIQELRSDGSGSGTLLNDTISIPIHVSAVNDAPAVVVPRQQTVVISGYQIEDVDLAGDICATVAVSSKQGHVSLASTTDLQLDAGSTGVYARYISFRASIPAVNAALKQLEYVRSPAFDGGDTIAVGLRDCNGTASLDERTLIELDINNRVGTTLPEALRPTIANIRPVRASLHGGTPVQVDGKNFIGHGPLFCQFGLTAAKLDVQATPSTDAKDASVGNVEVPAVIESQGRLFCVTPPASVVGSVLLRVTNLYDIWTNPAEFVFEAPPHVASVSPDRGTILGGSTITLHGKGFLDTETLQCLFGMVDATPARWISSTRVQCETPPALVAGAVDLQFSTNGQDFSQGHTSYSSIVGENSDTNRVYGHALRFTYDHEPTLDRAFPAQGAIAGGTLVKIFGKHFRSTMSIHCRFGSIDVAGTFLSSKTMRCLAPAAGQAGVVSLRVTMNGIDFSKDSLQFQYTSAIQVVGISPKGGFVAGGTAVEVSTRNLRRGSTRTALCRFGDAGVVVASFESRNILKCVSPPFRHNSNIFVALEISTNGQDFTQDGVRFHYQLPARVSAVSPPHGVVAGGTALSIFGRNFHDSEALFCAFGASVPSLWRRNANRPDTQCSYVFVSDADSCSSRDGGGGINNAAVRMPATKEGSEVTLTCFIRATWLSSTHIMCTTPPFIRGSVSVEVTTNDFDYTTNRVQFQYRNAPTLLSVYPDHGSSNGGTWVTINGTDFKFSSTLSCKFGEFGSGTASSVLATFLSATEIRCITPPSPSSSGYGLASISVLGNGADESSNALPFTYANLPTIARVEPSSGAVAGGTRVNVTGDNFRDSPALACSFGKGNVVPATFFSSTALSCVAPALIRSNNVTAAMAAASQASYCSVQISNNGQDFSLSAAEFWYQNGPEIRGILPSTGSFDGGTTVTIVGTGFSDASDLKCLFGEVEITGAFMNTTHMACKSPAFAEITQENSSTTSGSAVLVRVAQNGILTHMRSAIAFTYGALPIITSVSPCVGFSGVSTVVTVFGTFNQQASSLTCRFGNHLDVSATLVNASAIQCRTPSHLESSSTASLPTSSSTSSKVRVSQNFVDFSVTSASFTMHPAPRIASVSPSGGAITGGTVVRLTGSQFQNVSSAMCRFGSAGVVAAVYFNVTVVECVSPACDQCAQASRVLVEFSYNEKDFADSVVAFTYTASPTVSYVFPDRSNNHGGTVVAVTGYNFVDSASLRCKFDMEGTDANASRTVPARWESSEKIHCLVPSLGEPPYLDGRDTSAVLRVSNNAHDYSVDVVPFVFYMSAHVQTIHPQFGPLSGRTALSVKGTGFSFSNDLNCRFGEKSLSPASFVSETLVLCLSPSVEVAGNVAVVVVANGVDVSTTEAKFFFAAASRISAISPTSLPVAAGTSFALGSEASAVARTVLQIQGDGFINSTAFGENTTCVFVTENIVTMTVKATFVNASLITCLPPPTMTPGEAFVEVQFHSSYTTTNAKQILFYQAPTVHQVTPRSGSRLGGDLVTVSGYNFIENPGLCCYFGRFNKTKSTAKWLSSTSVQCQTPAVATAGDVFVQVSINGLQMPGNDDGRGNTASFTFMGELRFSSITPTFGTSEGNTIVSISGTNFYHNGEFHCLFDMQKSQATYVNDSLITCVAPPSGGIGSVTLRVAINGVVASNSTATFLYVTVPAVSRVEPSWSPTNGGTRITVHGSAFVDSPMLACLFEGTSKKSNNHSDGDSSSAKVVMSRSATYVSQSSLTCVAPPNHKEGTVSLKVSLNGQDSTREGLFFEFRREPQVLMISPSSGPRSGGTDIEIFGNNFLRWSGNVRCVFGNITSTPARWVSRTRVTCSSPVADQYVELTDNSSNSTSRSAVSFAIQDMYRGVYFASEATLSFTFQSETFVSSFHPAFSSLGSISTVVTVRGRGFYFTATLQCRFGNLTVRAKFVNQSCVQCLAPQAKVPGPVSIGVTNNGKDFFASEAPFHYVKSPRILQIVPSSVEFNSERKFITLLGAHFLLPNPNSNVTGVGTVTAPSVFMCQFGDMQATVGAVVNDSSIQCILPNVPQSEVSDDMTVQVQVIMNGYDLSNRDISFSFTRPVVATDASPRSGHIRGGYTVLVEGLNFIDSVHLQCRFGKVPSVAVWLSSSAIRCHVPPARQGGTIGGKVSLGVSNNGVDFVPVGNAVNKTVRKGFTYLEAPVIGALVPQRGYVRGGANVALNGHGFYTAAGLRCKFGHVSVFAAFLNTSTLVCQAPPKLNASTVLVSIVVNGTVVATAPSHFAYYPTPQIESLSPQIGEYGMSRELTVRGVGFLSSVVPGDTACRFSTEGDHVLTYITPAVVTSNNTLRCDSPNMVNNVVSEKGMHASLSRRLKVEVTFNGIEYTNNGVEFQVFGNELSIATITPASGPREGGSLISVYGQGFVNSPALACIFSANVTKTRISVRAQWVSETLITCLSPPVQKMLDSPPRYPVDGLCRRVKQWPGFHDQARRVCLHGRSACDKCEARVFVFKLRR